MLRGTFGYTEFGHRDATHLRWYTRRDLVALVGRRRLGRARGSWATFAGGHNRALDRLTLRRRRASSSRSSGTCSPTGPRESMSVRVLHLCHCYPPAVGGSETLMAELSRRLVAEHSHAVTVSTTTALSTADFRHPGVPQLAHGESWRTACSCAATAS